MKNLRQESYDKTNCLGDIKRNEASYYMGKEWE